MTEIEWTRPPGYKGETWNPTVGCSRVSEGCRNCYAERMAVRLGNMGVAEYTGLTNGDLSKPRWTGKVRELPERLSAPLRWKAPRCIFVNSMSDLFHESVSAAFIAAVFGVMAACPQHRFIILTKRAERLPRWFAWMGTSGAARLEACWHALEAEVATVGDGGPLHTKHAADPEGQWPLPNVILGVSVEDQETADERIPHLLQTPAACRMVSYEPALGGVDLGLQSATCDCCARWPSRWAVLRQPVQADLWVRATDPTARAMVAMPGVHRLDGNRHGALSARTPGGLLGIMPAEMSLLPGLDWVVAGGESGPGARPFDVEWARSTVRQCRDAGVAAFVKQLGALPVGPSECYGCEGEQFEGHVCDRCGDTVEIVGDDRVMHLRSKKGNDPAEWPADLRVRQWPAMLMDRAKAPADGGAR